MRKNLIISAAIGYNFKHLELFIKSLRKFYNDDICFLIENGNSELEKNLKNYNCLYVTKNISKKEIILKRHNFFAEFLQKTNYEKVFCCDCRDVYFQSNPFEYNFDKPINFFQEGKLIKDCVYNSEWILKTYRAKAYELIKNQTILCAGTVLGNKEKVLEYSNLMINNIQKYKYQKRLKYLLTFRVDPVGRGCDQAHANYIVHNNLIKDIGLHSNADGPVATAFYLKNINFDQNLNLLNSKNHPYSVVHQYDKRWSDFSQTVQILKKNLLITD